MVVVGAFKHESLLPLPLMSTRKLSYSWSRGFCRRCPGKFALVLANIWEPSLSEHHKYWYLVFATA